MISTKTTETSVVKFYFNTVYLGYAYQEVDGFYVFMFDESRGGCWSSYLLREIADKLDEMNKAWDDHINEYFKNNPPNNNQQTTLEF